MKVILTIKSDGIAPRFDMATEIIIADISEKGLDREPRTVLMPGPSADDLCSLILRENADMLVCGGIEEPFFQYLQWKKVNVIDRVIGTVDAVLRTAITNKLKPGMVVGNCKSSK